jgi:rhodanese-related sulfurtransferase
MMPATEKEIGPSSAMSEVLEAYPGARRALFRRYHIGGCSSCGFQPEETLQALCARNNNLDPSEVLARLKTSHEEDAKLQISPVDLAALSKAGTAVKLVDVRSRPEWEATRLPGALFMNQELVQEMMAKWPKDCAVVVYDHTGGQALDAVAYFAGHGMTNIRSLRGGIDAWSLEADSSILRYQVNRKVK